MPNVTASRRVDAPVERVWSVATDLSRATDVLSAVTRIELLTDGPFGVGTRWRETRRMFGKEATEEMWVTACDPAHGYTVEADSSGAHYVSTFTFTPVAEVTDVTLSFDARPYGRLRRVTAGVLGVVMTRPIAGQLNHDLADIATAAEGREG